MVVSPFFVQLDGGLWARKEREAGYAVASFSSFLPFLPCPLDKNVDLTQSRS
jgi:hypothetical protein